MELEYSIEDLLPSYSPNILEVVIEKKSSNPINVLWNYST